MKKLENYYSNWLFNNKEIFDVLELRCANRLERFANRTDVFSMLFTKKEKEEEKTLFEDFNLFANILRNAEKEEDYFNLILINKELFYNVWTKFDHMISMNLRDTEKTLTGLQKRMLNEFFIHLGLKKEKKSKGLNRKASRKDNPAEEKRRDY